MAMKEITLDDMIQGAIGDTEKEIFAEAVGVPEKPLDETHNTSVEDMGEGLEGQIEPEDEENETEGEPEGEAEGQTEGETGERDDKTQPDREQDGQERDDKGRFRADDGRQEPRGDHRVPLGELKSERERRQQAERQLEADRKSYRDEIAALNAKFDQIARGQQPQQQPQYQQQQPYQQSADPEPDVLLDPRAWQAWSQRRTNEQLRVQAAATQLAIGRIRHGETFDKAYAWVQGLDKNNPDNRRTIADIEAQPDIGEGLVRAYRRSEALREVGEDPAAYRERIAKEIREGLLNDPEFLAAARGERPQNQQRRGANDGGARREFRVPSLNAASGGSANAAADDPDLYNDSEKSVFAHAMRN